MRLARVNYILMTLSIWILQWWSRAFLKQMSFQYSHGFIVMLCLEDNACAVLVQCVVFFIKFLFSVKLVLKCFEYIPISFFLFIFAFDSHAVPCNGIILHMRFSHYARKSGVLHM